MDSSIKSLLITGSNGFIGKNLISTLACSYPEFNLLLFDRDSNEADLPGLISQADFVIHLAGVNRPQSTSEFKTGNVELTQKIIEILTEQKRYLPIMLASSIQAGLENPYGLSKRAAENLVFDYSQSTGAPVYVYRFPNVFGKWCRPNYNSVVATFCFNTANDLPIIINDPSAVLTLVYIDDLIDELLNMLKGHANQVDRFSEVAATSQASLGMIAQIIQLFPAMRTDLSIPNLSDGLIKKLYSTYLSYLPIEKVIYPLTMHQDLRGSFTEFIRTEGRGQISINKSNPGIVKGNHWHHTKTEKFLVVNGLARIRLRQIDSEQTKDYFVNGDKLEVIDIPVGYTHNIENIGDSELITVMWASEPFNPQKPDTYPLEV